MKPLIHYRDAGDCEWNRFIIAKLTNYREIWGAFQKFFVILYGVPHLSPGRGDKGGKQTYKKRLSALILDTSKFSQNFNQ